MQSGDSIDFTRKDFGGGWLLFVCFAVYFLTKLKKEDLVGGGFPKAARAVFTRALTGAAFAVPLVLALEIWQRWPSRQHFIRLRLESDRVVLGYRWPNPDLVIPAHDIENVAWILEGGIRYRTHRLGIKTPNEILRSFGISQLNDEEQLVLKKLRTLADENSKSSQPAATNSPPATLPLESAR